jgi:hypothetical protein
MPTSAALPDTITPQTRAHRHTRCGKPHPPLRHVSLMVRVTQNSARLQPTQRTSHTRIQNTDTQAPHARTTSRTAPTTAHRNHHCMHTAARTPNPHYITRHTAPRTPHAAHRKSHPVTHAASTPHLQQSSQAAHRPRDAVGELVAVQLQVPAGHTNSHRVTPCHPTPPPTPASRPQRIATLRIPSIKSSQMKASQHTVCYRSRTTPCASDPKNDATRQPTRT